MKTSPLKLLRAVRGLSQQDLGDAIGVSARTVHKWECGHGNPSMRSLRALAETFGLSLGTLIEFLAHDNLTPLVSEEAIRRLL